jgi:hypothetical protein
MLHITARHVYQPGRMECEAWALRPQYARRAVAIGQHGRLFPKRSLMCALSLHAGQKVSWGYRGGETFQKTGEKLRERRTE